jgi:hypothetical protein
VATHAVGAGYVPQWALIDRLLPDPVWLAGEAGRQEVLNAGSTAAQRVNQTRPRRLTYCHVLSRMRGAAHCLRGKLRSPQSPSQHVQSK